MAAGEGDDEMVDSMLHHALNNAGRRILDPVEEAERQIAWRPTSAPIEPSDDLTGTADDQLWSSAEVAAMLAVLAVLKGMPAPIERPAEIARAIGMLERNRASLVFDGKPELLAHFLGLAIKWGLALEAEVARLRADKERIANHPAEGEKI